MTLPRTSVTILVEHPTAPLRLSLTTVRRTPPEVAVTVEQMNRYGEAPERWDRVGLFSLPQEDALAFAEALVLTVTGGRRG